MNHKKVALIIATSVIILITEILLSPAIYLTAGLVSILGLIIILINLPLVIEKRLNRVIPHQKYIFNKATLEKHKNLVIMDWHSDSLLGDRNLLLRSGFAHMDIPRLQEGNTALQMFMAVTKIPAGQNYIKNRSKFDLITPLSMFKLWPASTWISVKARAVYQARKLHSFAEKSDNNLFIIKTKADLRKGIYLRESTVEKEENPPVLGLLGVEGLHALEGKLENIEILYNEGYRMMGLHHFFDNELGGSLHGISRLGLTNFGKEAVRRMEALSIIIDLSHSSVKVVDDVLALAKNPVVISHTGFYGACKSVRNISDSQMKQIADRGGIIGIGYWKEAVCDISPENIVKTIRYAIDAVGIEHVALGSDYDGATTVAFDTSELAVLTREMLKLKFRDDEIIKIMGANSVNFLSEFLPD